LSNVAAAAVGVFVKGSGGDCGSCRHRMQQWFVPFQKNKTTTKTKQRSSCHQMWQLWLLASLSKAAVVTVVVVVVKCSSSLFHFKKTKQQQKQITKQRSSCCQMRRLRLLASLNAAVATAVVVVVKCSSGLVCFKKTKQNNNKITNKGALVINGGGCGCWRLCQRRRR